MPQPGSHGKLAAILFAFTLVAFVVESQLTQYVQTELGFRQPYFVFYIVHSAFLIMCPLHFLFLMITSKQSPRAFYRGLHLALAEHISPTFLDQSGMFPTWGFVRLNVFLAIAIAVPALLWFIAITFAPLTDVTALWNTNAFFAYVLTVKVFGLKWEARRLASVLIATLGAAAVVYGGSGASDPSDASAAAAAKSAVIGDVLTLVASILYGVYQVTYKLYAALPTDPDHFDTVPVEPAYEPITDSSEDLQADLDVSDKPAAVYPPPFGLYANALTSAIGVFTAILLWIPIPILHYLDIERFRLPSDIKTVLVLGAISLSGVIFNAGLMILLGLWGPIVTSVGNLLTIVLVFISDILFGRGTQGVTFWGMLGSTGIVFAFGVLAYDMLK